MPKIALTYIVKDNSELQDFKKSLKSYMPYFDGLFVVVNGLSGQHDLIHREVKKYKGKSISISPETHPAPYRKKADGSWKFVNFAAARQISFDLVPDSYDYVSWADVDDILLNGAEFRTAAEKAYAQKLDIVYFTYWYACLFDENRNVREIVINHERERLIDKKKFKWDKWLHEVCTPITGHINEYKVGQYTFDEKLNQKVAWVHQSGLDKGMESLLRNIEILELQAEDEKYEDPRTILYLGKTYFDLGKDEDLLKADEYFDKYLPMSGWDEEIGVAWHYKGLIRQRLGKDKEAIPCYKEAIKAYPKNHLDYLRLADAYFKTGNFDEFAFWLKLVPVLPELKSKATITSPYEVKLLFLTLKYLEAEKLGKIEDMHHYAKLRHEYVKDGLLEQMDRTIELNKAAEFIHNYAVFLLKYEMYKEVFKLLDTLPEILEGEEFTKQIVNKLPGREHDDRTIVYFASAYRPHFEKWNGNSLHVGIGGSESAVIYLAEEWAKIGYNVIVYCDTPQDQVINGVLYMKYWKINWNDVFNVLILWRTPELIDIGFKSRKLFVDLHDICIPQLWTKQRCDRVDKVFFKSRWHAEQIPQLDLKKRVVISNGITL